MCGTETAGNVRTEEANNVHSCAAGCAGRARARWVVVSLEGAWCLRLSIDMLQGPENDKRDCV